MIIFDEYQYAESLFKKEFKGYISWRDLFILAKYYRYLGKSTSQTRKEIERFCEEKIFRYNEYFYDQKIESVLKKSKYQELKIPKEVVITKSEIERIRSIKNYRLEKILFILLVIGKNGHSNDGKYYVNQNFSSIVPLARVYMSRDERDRVKHYLFEEGFIVCPEPHRFIVKNKKESFKILYVDNKTEEYLKVTDFSKIISFYKPLCEKCGNEVDVLAKRHRLCRKCYLEHLLEIKRISKKKNLMAKDNYENVY
jgi:hypothetical protein